MNLQHMCLHPSGPHCQYPTGSRARLAACHAAQSWAAAEITPESGKRRRCATSLQLNLTRRHMQIAHSIPRFRIVGASCGCLPPFSSLSLSIAFSRCSSCHRGHLITLLSAHQTGLLLVVPNLLLIGKVIPASSASQFKLSAVLDETWREVYLLLQLSW